jgi:hypothetical protein
MPQLVACPSCGCKVQAGDVLLGRRTRCIACGNVFVAAEALPSLRLPGDPDPYPLRPDEDAEAPPRRDDWPRGGPARQRLPLCPRCHRPVAWDAPACVHCNHLLEGEDGDHPPPGRRRDCDDHRGPLIDSLGTISLLCSVMGLCTAGIGVVAGLITGIVAVTMARSDLARMRRGEMDPDGAPATETGRNKGIAGIVLAVVFGAVVVLFGMDYFFSVFP